MNEQECLSKMKAPGDKRPNAYMKGVIQIWVTRACDKACFNCTQGSNLTGKPEMISLDQYEQAVKSLRNYYGVVGMFGGNPAMHPRFKELCSILASYIPKERRGLWCNNPITESNAVLMAETFNPSVSNLNVHLDANAFALFRKYWPGSGAFGLYDDSRHSPPFVAMKDVVQDEGNRWNLISNCDVNQNWSAMIGVFRGELRAWFCELAGAQAMLHQHEPDYPDTGIDPNIEYEALVRPGERLEKTLHKWWQLPMTKFTPQVHKHCHECGIPLRGYGELAQGDYLPSDSHQRHTPTEQCSQTHASVVRSKIKGRPVQIVTTVEQLRRGLIDRATNYLSNSMK